MLSLLPMTLRSTLDTRQAATLGAHGTVSMAGHRSQQAVSTVASSGSLLPGAEEPDDDTISRALPPAESLLPEAEESDGGTRYARVQRRKLVSEECRR